MEPHEIAIILLAVVAFLLAAAWHSRREAENKLRRRIRKLWGNLPDREYRDGEYEQVSHYFENRKPEGFTIDDITWNDLDMDSLFVQMNNTCSSAGEEVLYKVLRTPLTGKDGEEILNDREKLITYFSDHETERVALQMELSKIGYTRRLSMSDYLSAALRVNPDGAKRHILHLILMAAAIGYAVFSPETGVLVVIIAAVYNAVSYYNTKMKVEPYFISLEHIARLTRYAKRASALHADGVLQEKYDELKKTSQTLDGIRKGTGLFSGASGQGGNPAQLVMDYLLIFFHWDLIRFYQLIGQVHKKEAEVFSLWEQIGMLETAIAIASYRKMMPYTCIPELSSGNAEIHTEELYHPLLRNPVSNSLDMERPILLTGSNASGKSTFLKSVAIGQILAQTIHTVPAKNWNGPFCEIYSSMALRDDISSGESYFIVEIKSLKRILDTISENQNPDVQILCFVDEVLRGTNTVERIAASSQILKEMSERHAMVFAATHDIELTELLSDYYENYHFEESVEDRKVSFNYKLLPGKATTRNAIRLLDALDYPEEVVKAAETSAAKFTETGSWT